MEQQQANGGSSEKVDLEPTSSSSAAPAPARSGALARIAKTVHMLMKSKNRVASAIENREQSEFMKKHGLVQKRTEVTSDEASSAATIAGPPPSLKKRLAAFVIDPSQNLYYWWTMVISVAVMYNLLVVVARIVFNELQNAEWMVFWLSCDLLSDFVYALDFLIHFRTGFLEQGLLVRDLKKLATTYAHSKDFKICLASLVPLDYVPTLLNLHWPPYLRLNRLLRIGRVQEYIVRTETRSNFPNVFRVGCVILYIVVIIHWNGCVYFAISEWMGLNNDTWVYGSGNTQSLPEGTDDNLFRRYVYSFYWSTLTLTTIGEVPQPVKDIEIVFVTADFLIGVLIFATIVGNVGSMIANMSAARTEFQNKMDAIKQYMELRRVGKELEERVIMWFDYLWSNTHSLSDEDVLKTLPAKLQAEIAMHVHFDTLRKVRIFQDCEAGLLAELVLKLQLQVFSPGDYICRKGDIGREMYIVKRGKLDVVADDGIKVFVTLGEGAVFGELSILNIAGSKHGNRRTANVRSVGYTDLFMLSKDDLWDALKEYPDARKLLIAKGREILKKDNLLDESAPEEHITADEKAEKLEQAMETLQTRFARLFAEFTNNQKKLNDRIKFLEKQLEKYKAVAAAAKIQNLTLTVEDTLSRFGSRMSRLSIVPPISDQLPPSKNNLST